MMRTTRRTIPVCRYFPGGISILRGRPHPDMRGGLVLLALAGLLGCADLGGKPPLPSGVPDQQSLKTVAGARAMYQGAVATFGYTTFFTSTSGTTGSVNIGAFVSALLSGGLVSDELTVASAGGSLLDYYGVTTPDIAMDSRNLPEGSDYSGSYGLLQTLRAQAAQGIGALTAYDSSEHALRGHLYALTGYAELLLADLYCSGVPLSTLDYNADYTYRPGSSTEAVYADAAQQFRLALPLLADSARWLNLARVGLGRALLNLGQYAAAADTVATVPHDYVYQIPVNWNGGDINNDFVSGLQGIYHATVADREGGIGFPYRTGGDRRTATIFTDTNKFRDSLFVPAKYGTGVSRVTVASGLEARLIQAEAALHPGGGNALASDPSAMLAILNAIRADSNFTPTIDPSTVLTPAAAVDTLFADRAAWLFLDGHRLEDLRRQLRRYKRLFLEVFPVGAYVLPSVTYPSYGLNVELPIPPDERTINPNFTGCLSRGI